MPYKTIVNNSHNSHLPGYTEGEYQIRVAIHPESLKAKNEIIVQILKDVFKDYPGEVKLWSIDKKQENIWEGEYDGTISTKGKDREQRGKEICIYVPGRNHALSNKKLKKLLLTLWKRLESAEVQLLYITPPGDCKIPGPKKLPTPFSFISNINEVDWQGKHGILFKEFKNPTGDHPLTRFKFTRSDVNKAAIKFDAFEIARSQRSYYKTHQDMALKRLNKEIESIKNQPRTYEEILNDDSIVQNIKQKIIAYRAAIVSVPEDDREAFRENFLLELNRDDVFFKFIIENYPHQADSGFTDFEIIAQLRNWASISKAELDQSLNVFFDGLRSNYSTEIAKIESDFANHQAEHSIKINWEDYIPGFNEPAVRAELIAKNPAQLQAMYRRIVLLEREKLAYENFKEQWLLAHYKDKNISPQLQLFSKSVQALKKNNKIDRNVVTHFEALQNNLEEELFSHPACRLQKTAYPDILDHFTELATKLNSDEIITIDAITQNAVKLDQILEKKAPITPRLTSVIGGVIGAVVGFVLGFGAGAAMTFWGGGFGAIPCSLAGMGLGLVIGGGAGVASALFGAGVGFFNGKHSRGKYQRDLQATQASRDNLYQALGAR